MLAQSSFPVCVPREARAAVVIDMIGDVDAAAAQSFAALAGRLQHDPHARIVLNLRRAAILDAAGITLLARAIADVRRRGFALDVVAESRRVRTALLAARIPSRPGSPLDREAGERHIMIVRNTDPSRD